MEAKDKIIVALDNMRGLDAVNLASIFKGKVWGFKVNDLFLSEGPAIIERLNVFGEVFLDLKFHDIPSTVANYARKASAIKGIKIFSVHATGGIEMMKAAVENKGNCEVFPVTILDSLPSKDCQRIYGMSFGEKVIQLARDSKEAGVDGIICPARILENFDSVPDLKDLQEIAVGVRPSWAPKDEHIYPVAPKWVIQAGAYKLVIGRPITKPPPEIGSPMKALEKIVAEIENASRES